MHVNDGQSSFRVRDSRLDKFIRGKVRVLVAKRRKRMVRSMLRGKLEVFTGFEERLFH